MYNEKVMEVFKNPQHMGEVENYNAKGTVGNEVCGDIMQITMKIEDNIIKDAKFKTFGCAAAVASSSTATGMVIGKSVDDALKLTNKQVIEELEGLPPQKIHCSVLAEDAIREAIEDYRARKNGEIPLDETKGEDEKEIKYV
jgi:nitrogen fixation NifU-like protein